MVGFGLRKNMAFDWNGTGFRIDRLQSSGDLLLERIEDGHISIVQRDQLLAEYRLGKISAKVLVSGGESPTDKVFSRPLDELSQGV